MRREFIKEVKGDLLAMFKQEDSELDVIAHGANCFNTMGAGIALEIKKQFPEAFWADMYYEIPIGDMRRLGNISGAHNNEVYNIYTQFKGGANADYCALTLGLRKLNALFAKDKDIKTLGLPLIGCGIGGLEWKKVKQIILKEITDMNIVIVHFQGNYLEKKPITTEEFNSKWKFHIEPGFETQGLMINNQKVITFLDKMFTSIPENKMFTYSQIKLKFGLPTVYMTEVSKEYIEFLENKILELLEEKE